MSTQRTYSYLTDAAHGWLEVPMIDVMASHIKVTTCSYRSRDGRTAYLEEDVDAPAFLGTLKVEPTLKFPPEDYGWIRQLPGFHQ